MHVSASSRAVPTRCCPLTARHLHAPGGAPRRCQRHGAVSVKCIATAGAPDESSGGDGQSLWGGRKGSSDSPQAPPAAGRDPPRGGVSGSGAGAPADSRSTGARGAWGLSSNDKALPLSLLYPYERLPTGDKTQFSLHQPCSIEKDGSCKLDTQLHVWERPCGACNGSGFASSSRHRRKSSYSSTSICMLCSGIGYVRCSSTRLLPHLGDGSGDVSGWGRSSPENGNGQ